MSKIERSKRFETERIHTPRNRLRTVLGCWRSRQLRNRLHRLTSNAPARTDSSSGGMLRRMRDFAISLIVTCVGVFVIACLI